METISTPFFRIGLALALLAALYLLYIRLGRQGKVVFSLAATMSAALLAAWPSAALALLPAALLALVLSSRRGKTSEYVPASARIEGGGIKRGLTPPEGAVLLGRPLNLTLTLVIFEMLRKGFLRQTGHTPLVVEVAQEFRTHGSGLSAQARGEKRRKAAQRLNAALHKYEEPFLEIIEANPGVPVNEMDLGVAIQPLIRYVAGRVGGFSIEETRAYYHLIIERAPREARSDGRLTFERQKVFDRNFGWVLQGENFAAVLDTADLSYMPVWQRKQAGLLPQGNSFAQWAQSVMAAMGHAVAEKDVKIGLGRETDAVMATLMNDIARATYYG
jgi:hypothetical protein